MSQDTAQIRKVQDKEGTQFFPITHVDAVIDENGDAVSTLLAGKQATLVSGTNIKTINSQSLLGSGNIVIEGGGGGGSIDSIVMNGDAVTVTGGVADLGTVITQHQDISGKADKVSNSTNGNFAGLDANGNLTDSGHKHSDYQAALVSGTNIKTVNSTSLLGSGNVSVGTYSKPSDGIPKTDLASAVQTSLGKADTALQSYTETDPVFSASTAASISSSDISNWNGKQDTISDLSDIRSGAALGATALQSYTETDPTVPSWAKASSKPSYTFSEIETTPTTISGYGITDAKIANGTITLGNDTITPLTSFTETDPVFSAAPAASIQSTDISAWNAKLSGVTFNGVSATVTDGVAAITATIPAAPGTLQTNLTTAQTASASEALSGSIKLHKIAKTGTYSDLIGTPTIPTKVSDLTNDAGYTTNTGTVTRVDVGTSQYSPTSGIVSLPAYPTTLPASDVSAWAKEASKPSYTLDEVSDGSTRKLANYLPLTGGTISTNSAYPLAVEDSRSGSVFTAIAFGRSGNNLGFLGFDGEDSPVYLNHTAGNTYPLLHTGNFVAGTNYQAPIPANTYAPYNSNGYLPLSGGTMTANAAITWGNNDRTDWATYVQGVRLMSSTSSSSGAPTQYSSGINIKSRYGVQLAHAATSNRFWGRVENQSWVEFYHTGNASLSSSDSRIKDNQELINKEEAFTVIMGLKPKSWTWVNYTKENDGKKAAGLVAQDVKEILPEAVTVLENEKFEDFHFLNYKTIQGYEIAAIKGLIEEVKTLRAEIAELKKQIK